MTFTTIEIVLLILAIIIIASVTMQKHKTVGYMNSPVQSSDSKKRGFELFLYRVTGITTFLFFVLAIVNIFI